MACVARWTALRHLEIQLPQEDVRHNTLIGVERVRIYYMPLGTMRPQPHEVLSKGELLLEQRRPDLPSPGEILLMDLKQINRPSGWIVATAVRVGGILGEPSEVLPWLDPVF